MFYDAVSLDQRHSDSVSGLEQSSTIMHHNS